MENDAEDVPATAGGVFTPPDAPMDVPPLEAPELSRCPLCHRSRLAKQLLVAHLEAKHINKIKYKLIKY